MSFTFYEILNSVFCALIFGVGFSFIWSVPLCFLKSPFAVSCCIVSFGLGFMLLSYFSLDGELRLYMLIISSTAFFVSKKYVFERILGFVKKMVKKVANIPLFGRFKRLLTLDKSK